MAGKRKKKKEKKAAKKKAKISRVPKGKGGKYLKNTSEDVKDKGLSGIKFTQAVPARVEELIGRTGTRGEAIQVRCRVLKGRDKDKVLRRNVKGPVQKNDILMLRETEIEAKQLSKAGRGG